MKKIRLVPDWRRAWRWYSVNCPMLAVALLGTWATLPDAMQSAFTQGQLQAMAIGLIVLGVGGRLIDQSPKEGA